eukprot:jgi/Chrzof1/9608/Cz04g09160.t1
MPSMLIQIELSSQDFNANTLEEFRQNWLYNHFDAKYNTLSRTAASYVEWDDHEVTNNWYPGEAMPRSGSPPADVLAVRGRQAFDEYNPITPGRLIYGSFKHGKHLEVFLVDMRTYRGPNPQGNSTTLVEMFGQEQFNWLKTSLKNSKATWKVISIDDPLAYSTGGPGDWDAFGQNNPAILGREFQLKELLAFINRQRIKGVVFITADVHMASAIEYSPARATGGFTDYKPFWEIVVGPCHAGSFNAPPLDSSFGPEHKFIREPSNAGFSVNDLPPPYTSSFGYGSVSKKGELTLQVRDITGAVLFTKTWEPEDKRDD